MLSEYEKETQEGIESVLILVLMEDALGARSNRYHCLLRKHVLILVLMEDALGGPKACSSQQIIMVLILVLMEDALGAKKQTSIKNSRGS